jgi:hypothetical protein
MDLWYPASMRFSYFLSYYAFFPFYYGRLAFLISSRVFRFWFLNMMRLMLWWRIDVKLYY